MWNLYEVTFGTINQHSKRPTIVLPKEFYVAASMNEAISMAMGDAVQRGVILAVVGIQYDVKVMEN